MKITIQPPAISFKGTSVLIEENIGCFFKIIDCEKHQARLCLGKIVFIVKLNSQKEGNISLLDLNGYEWNNSYNCNDQWVFEKLNIKELKFILE